MEDTPSTSTPRRIGRKAAAGAFALVAVVFVAGMYVGIHQSATFAQTAPETVTVGEGGVTSVTLNLSGGSKAPQSADMTPLWRTWNLLEANFVQTHASGTMPTDEDKVYGAIQGLVDSYGDPYTSFFPPQDAKMFDDNINGSFGGVGMEIGTSEGVLVVVSPLKKSPAEAAGIRAGDKIIAIDSTESAHLPVDEAVKLIRGEKGTTVKITVSRTGESDPHTISIVRNTIKIPTIDYREHAGSKVFEIDLYNFSAVSADEFRDALRAYWNSGDTRLLIDLRGNPGGYLDAAVSMASYFLPAGSTVVTEDFRGARNNVIHRSLGYDIFKNKKVAVAILVDQGTASAAEILAGALQQHGVAKVFGTRTFGKGSVQELFDVGGGAQVKITIARWLTPDGSSISDGGLTPDFNATTTAKDIADGRDPQKDAAMQWLANQ